MKSKTERTSELLNNGQARTNYVRAKLTYLIPAQIRALRLSANWTQGELGRNADMKQARISAIESPGEVNFNLETLVRIAAAFKVGLQVRFVPYSDMLNWENEFSQDSFNVRAIDDDSDFFQPEAHSSTEQQVRLGTSDRNQVNTSRDLEIPAGNFMGPYTDNFAAGTGGALWQ